MRNCSVRRKADTLPNKIVKKFFISLVICVILSSCRELQEPPVVIPSVTPNPSTTETPTPKKPRPTRTFAPALTLTPLPAYQTKDVLLSYYVSGDHSVYDFFFDQGSLYPWSKFVLYTDGQLIIPGKTYKQKMLSANEVKRFLSSLEALDFYSIESNQKHDPTDKLYNYGDNFQKSYDGLLDCIAVNGDKSRELCAYEPSMEYLVPKMKNILHFLETYEPAGMTPYFPDRILLYVYPGRDQFSVNLPPPPFPGQIIYLPWKTPPPLLMWMERLQVKSTCCSMMQMYRNCLLKMVKNIQ
jgi:hypothetical protein